MTDREADGSILKEKEGREGREKAKIVLDAET